MVTKFTGDGCWTPKSLGNSNAYYYSLTSRDFIDILSAVESIPECKRNSTLAKQDINLGDFGFFLEKDIHNRLENGLGFVVIKGLSDISDNEQFYALALQCIGLYLGKTLSQSINGEHMHRVEDEGYGLDHPKARGTNTNIKLWFHNDTCDVSCLLCVKPAIEGGLSQIVSSSSINNEMYDSHHELLKELYKPYPFMRHNINTTMEAKLYMHPVISNIDDKIVCNILRPLIDKAKVFPEGVISSKQIEALDVFEDLCHDERFCYEFPLGEGDILMMNSFSTLHSRTKFSDSLQNNKKRLLLRLWLSVSNSRKLPESYKYVYGATTPGSYRGGIKKAIE
jgi:hypothetical protein|tara:strand:- start:44221 stop:45234 length:1014 start_codon:yes stop_codon:yes gene_type:complete